MWRLKMGSLVEGESLKCKVCNRIVFKLVGLNDNGSGKKICRDCKRELRRKEQKRIKDNLAF
jgi:hypothetical protein